MRNNLTCDKKTETVPIEQLPKIWFGMITDGTSQSFSISTKLVERASEYVLDLLSNKLDAKYIFHNQRYTVQTVHAVGIIAAAEELPLHDQLILQMSAWFHHVGYISSDTNHRQSSADEARAFLARYEVDQEAISAVSNCILHSESPWDVSNSLDMILYDADWYFLAASNYREMLERRKEEMVQVDGKLSPLQWSDFIDECFLKHQYLTNFGQEFLHNRRRLNYFNYKKSPESEWAIKQPVS